MRKTLAILIAASTLVTATAANADDWRYHHGPRPGYGGGYHGGGGNWVAPLVGGLIVGGILGSMAEQNQYQQPQYYQPQTFCRLVPVYDAWGNFVGRQRQCWQQ